MEKPKIIHVIYAGLGGHAHVLFPLLESSFGTEFENYVVFFGVENTLPAYIAQCEKLGVRYSSIQKKPRRYLKAFKAFKKILNLEKPDSILVHSSELIVPAVKYARHTSVKAIYIEHENNASKGLSLSLISKYALKKASAVVCLNVNYKKELEKKFSCNVPIHIIPNGVDTKTFAPTVPTKQTPVRLGMASRMILGKDHATLLYAFKKIAEKHPDVELHIAGNGPTLEAVQSLVAELNLANRVRFSGLLNADEMLDFYASLSIYILATNYETLSTALLQAMACELPIITSNIENNAALIKHDTTGLLYEDQNSVDLEQKIDFALKNRGKMLKMGQAARQTVIKNYSTTQMAENYAALVRLKK